MKKISLCLLSGLLLLSSCLDEDPKYTTDETVVYASESSAQMALNGIYALMAIQGSFAQLLPEVSTEASGICWTSYNYSDIRAQYVDGAISTDNEFNDRVWGALYQTISNCNIFIEACESDRSSDFDGKENMVAQAKFMRAVCYFYLYNYWGGVPLRVEPSSTENLNMPRASRQEVLDQIIKDWSEAAIDLDDESTLSSVPTAPCKSSAWAYLAKIYWLMGCNAWAAENGDTWANGQLKTEWPEMESDPNTYFRLAKQYGDSVFQANVFALEPNYQTLFGGTRLTFSDEFVFVVDATMNTTENVGYNSLHWTFSPQECSPGESWGRAQPNKAFYNWARGTYQDDPRLDYTFVSLWTRYVDGSPSDETQVAYPYVSQSVSDTTYVDSVIRGVTIRVPVITTTTEIVDSIYYTIPSTNADGDYSNEFFADVRNPKPSELDSLLRVTYCQTKSADSWNINDWPYWSKYMTTNCSGRYADNNLYVYRYSDFLLLMADVENELGNTGTAMGYVNQVLNRARQSTDKSGNSSHTYPKAISGMSQTELREYIFNERLFELACEFDNFMDTRRRGISWRKDVLMRNNNDSITSACYHYGLSVNYSARWREYWYPLSIENATDAEWNEFLIKNQLFPIPRVEFTTNSSVSATSDQNYGY